MLKNLLLSLSLLLATSSAAAQTASRADTAMEPSVAEEVGYGVGSALANVFYIPVKVTYAGLGLLTGGIGFIVSGGQAEFANKIIHPAVRGTYVVTPDHLRGKDPIQFLGASAAGPDTEEVPDPPQATR